MTKKPIKIEGLASLIEQTARLLHSAGHSHGHYPAHWTALRYFRDATPSARTQGKLAEFQNMHLGPVARTVRTLLDKGLLERRPNPKSRRADFIELTPTGRELLKLDPREQIIAILEVMPPEQHEALAQAMTTLLSGLHNVQRASDEEHADE